MLPIKNRALWVTEMVWVFGSEKILVSLTASVTADLLVRSSVALIIQCFSFVAGIYYTTAIVGPAIGYVLGGQLLQIYTDYLTVDPTE